MKCLIALLFFFSPSLNAAPQCLDSNDYRNVRFPDASDMETETLIRLCNLLRTTNEDAWKAWACGDFIDTPNPIVRCDALECETKRGGK